MRDPADDCTMDLFGLLFPFSGCLLSMLVLPRGSYRRCCSLWVGARSFRSYGRPVPGVGYSGAFSASHSVSHPRSFLCSSDSPSVSGSGYPNTRQAFASGSRRALVMPGPLTAGTFASASSKQIER